MHRAVRPLAHHATAPVTAKAIVKAATTEKAELTKFDRKAFKKEVKHQLAAAPKSTTVEGKSQIVAAVLCFFLGGLGIHDFYLGRVGKGILQIILSILLVGFILVIIDFIRILLGTEKPKDGDYAKKL
ncbi:TM2 domain-containing protein [Hymenobacter sp. BRD67]|uniref:TM2 domain-containing protein n=1 Tax=Hymenobacter sp. BRD67 TaxID=2675877 RepID=UPI0015646514|nr:TM2 domain-containing protein [Hymenobacter sp. BRD67]QKG53526.1 TM2 domain-containing protein [Hymenobacter sp. BRD67]